MMSAPSEMRCRLTPVNFMTTKVMASTIGIAIATTMPGRQPSDRKPYTTRDTRVFARSRMVPRSGTRPVYQNSSDTVA